MQTIPKRRAFASYEWMIALRYMIPNKKQMFTSVISVISLIGILVGVWALIVVMSVMNGFRTELLDRILGVNGHLIVQSLDKDFSDYPSLIPRLDDIDGVKFVLPIVQGQGLAQGNVEGGTGALVRGMRQNDLEKMAVVANNIKAGTLSGFDDGDSVAVGAGMARKLGLRVGDDMRLVSPDGDVTPFGVNPRVKAYRIAAIFEIGMHEYDSTIVFMPLKETQLFFNLGDSIQSLEVFLNNPDQVDAVKPALMEAINRATFLIDWRQRNQAFFSALQIESNVMFIILSLIVLVAALNIVSGLIMLVKDKGHDIAILRTMGAPKAAVLRIFMLTGMVIGVAGTLLGVFFAILTCLNIENIQAFVSWLFNVDVFNPQLYFLTQLPARLEWGEVFWVIVMALFLSFIATLLPAWRAARLDPVKAMRYE